MMRKKRPPKTIWVLVENNGAPGAISGTRDKILNLAKLLGLRCVRYTLSKEGT